MTKGTMDNAKDEITETLRDCEQTLRRLKARRRLSAEASQTFGDLAAKLNEVIDRRSGVDRRAVGRDDLDHAERS